MGEEISTYFEISYFMKLDVYVMFFWSWYLAAIIGSGSKGSTSAFDLISSRVILFLASTQLLWESLNA